MNSPNIFESTLIKKHRSNRARVMKVRTPHGDFVTPCFMPVGTRAAVNCMNPKELLDAGVQIILGGNTYHMLCSPGLDVIEKTGGMHKFMSWNKPMLIDSGGFQIFSLSKNQSACRVDDSGAKFKIPDSGDTIHLTPENSIRIQKTLGADIVMSFDQCTEDSAGKEIANEAMQRTHRWLKSSLDCHLDNVNSIQGKRQAFFGIVQGGFFEDLRKESAEVVSVSQTDGVAIGGETIGFEMAKTIEILNWIEPILPSNKIRYTMGVGLIPQNLIDVAQMGVDIFDCVAPTRNARHGSLYSGRIEKRGDWLKFESEHKNGKINLNNSKFANDSRPIMEDCTCFTCKNYSRAYLRHLLKLKSLSYYSLATTHNIQVTQDVCDTMRALIISS